MQNSVIFMYNNIQISNFITSSKKEESIAYSQGVGGRKLSKNWFQVDRDIGFSRKNFKSVAIRGGEIAHSTVVYALHVERLGLMPALHGPLRTVLS